MSKNENPLHDEQLEEKEAVEQTDNQEDTPIESTTEEETGKKKKRKRGGRGGNSKKKVAELEQEVQEAEEEIVALREEVQAQKEKYLRLFAEFDNYKKRTARERIELTKTASRDIMESLLPILDDFNRAIKAAEENENESIPEGILLVSDKFQKTLENKGLQKMESNGATFDPDLHEALTRIPAPTEELKGKVIDTIEAGYYLNEKIIRYAKVVVGS